MSKSYKYKNKLHTAIPVALRSYDVLQIIKMVFKHDDMEDRFIDAAYGYYNEHPNGQTTIESDMNNDFVYEFYKAKHYELRDAYVAKSKAWHDEYREEFDDLVKQSKEMRDQQAIKWENHKNQLENSDIDLGDDLRVNITLHGKDHTFTRGELADYIKDYIH